MMNYQKHIPKFRKNVKNIVDVAIGKKMSKNIIDNIEISSDSNR